MLRNDNSDGELLARFRAVTPNCAFLVESRDFIAIGGHLAKTLRGLSTERVRELARSGAEALLKQLRAEIIAVERTFPELALPQRRQAVRQTIQKVRKRGRKMSAAARKAVSARMKKYWAERRKAKRKVK